MLLSSLLKLYMKTPATISLLTLSTLSSGGRRSFLAKNEKILIIYKSCSHLVWLKRAKIGKLVLWLRR